MFLYGNCGRGKSLLGRYVLPALLFHFHRKVTTVYDAARMNRCLDEVLGRHIVSLDDIGTEDVVNVYGNRRHAFPEIMDAAEKHGKLLIVSTNLDAQGISQQYGDRTLDRIKSCMCRIAFRGNSLRK